MNEKTKFNKSMNRLDFTGIQAIEMNMFIAIITKARDKQDTLIELSYKDIKKLIKDKSHLTTAETFEALELMKKQLFNISSDIIFERENGKRESHMFHIFNRFDNYEQEQKLHVSISEDYLFLLNDLNNFDEFSLGQFMNLKRVYSKNLFRVLMSFKDIGHYEFWNINHFRRMVGLPDTFENKKIKPMLDNCLKEFDKFGILPGISYVIEKDKKSSGAPIKSIKFKWQPIIEGTIISEVEVGGLIEEGGIRNYAN